MRSLVRSPLPARGCPIRSRLLLCVGPGIPGDRQRGRATGARGRSPAFLSPAGPPAAFSPCRARSPPREPPCRQGGARLGPISYPRRPRHPRRPPEGPRDRGEGPQPRFFFSRGPARAAARFPAANPLIIGPPPRVAAHLAGAGRPQTTSTRGSLARPRRPAGARKATAARARPNGGSGRSRDEGAPPVRAARVLPPDPERPLARRPQDGVHATCEDKSSQRRGERRLKRRREGDR